jgi:hypothetical protein
VAELRAELTGVSLDPEEADHEEPFTRRLVITIAVTVGALVPIGGTAAVNTYYDGHVHRRSQSGATRDELRRFT